MDSERLRGKTTISVCSAPKPKARRIEEIMKTRAKINETENLW